MRADPPAELVAGEVRAGLLNALGPVWRSTLACLQAQPELAKPEEIVIAVQLAPAVVRVFREAEPPERAAAELVAMRFDVLPDDGASLMERALGYVAGVLSGHDEGAADRALAYAQARRDGGFLLLVRPLTGETRLFLAKAGEGLGQSLDLGGIVRRVTVH